MNNGDQSVMDVNLEAADKDILDRELERAADLSEWLETASTEDVIRSILEQEEKLQEHDRAWERDLAELQRLENLLDTNGPIVAKCRKAESPQMIQAICFDELIKTLDKGEPDEVNLFKMVQDFNKKFGLGYEGPPRLLPPELYKLKEKHLHEELTEYKKACAKGDLIECLDALIDLVYVALGAAYMHGFEFNEGFRRVHAANMTKIRATKSGQSKRGSTFDVVKPEGWEPADLSDLVEE